VPSELANILGKAPFMVTIKRLDTTGSHITYHALAGLGYFTSETTNGYTLSTTYWTAAPTTQLLPALTTNAEVNASGGRYLATVYFETDFIKSLKCAAADGFINLGGKAHYVYAKHDAAGMNHNVWNATRDPGNPAVRALQLNAVNAENVAGAWEIDIDANGIKLRGTNTDLDPPLYGFAIIQPNGPTENTAR